MKKRLKFLLRLYCHLAIIGFSAISMIGCPTPDEGTIPTETSPTVINISAIGGITAPITGETPVAVITETEQFTGTVSWFPPVNGTFAASTHYMATITLTAKNGYTMNGVADDFFTVAGATASNPANSGSISAVFPTTAGTLEHPAIIDIAEIDGVTFPISGGTPVTIITETMQYTGTVAWNGNPTTFAEGTAYTAVITLTAKNGFTLNGVTTNFFTVVGATTRNEANSGIVTAEFPVSSTTPVFGISLSVTGTRTFGTVAQGYTSASPVVSVIITNTSEHATGPLTVSLSGAGANGFTLSTASISSIVANGVSSFSVIRKAGLAEGSYEATVTVSGGNGITAAFNVSFTVTTLPYVITESDTTFTATRGGVIIGTANKPIQNVIEDIRANAESGTAAIQFDNGISVLDIGTATITFDNTEEEKWGTIILLGKITGNVGIGTTGTIVIGGNVSLTSVGDITNTAATNGRAIYHNSTGTVTISSGTVLAATGIAIRNASTGKIIVSGTAKVTSENVTSGEGTILIANSGTETDPRLEISGGTVENTGEGTVSASAVYNASTGAVNISGGAVTAISFGRAVYNNSTGLVAISGGTVSAISGSAVYNYGNGSMLTISGGTISSQFGATVYNATSSAGGGTATISGGTISSISTYAVNNSSSGTVNITGGTVSSLTGIGAINYSTGMLNISGGKVYSVNKTALHNNSSGKITISGDALITASNPDNPLTGGNPGTIYIGATSSTNVLLEISGGRVENINGYATLFHYSAAGTINITGGTVSAISGYAIQNYTTGIVNISGGTVSATSSYTVYNYAAGTVNISDGTVSATSGRAVSNSSTGAVTISGGTVSATTGYAAYNASTGAVTITGGTVSATTGYAAYNSSTGKITVSQPTATATLVTSANANAAQGTVVIASSGSATADRLVIEGGIIENTAVFGNAVYNASTGAVTMSGGTVRATATGGNAIYNNTTGALNVTGGTVQSTAPGIPATFTASYDFESGTGDWVLVNGDQTNKWMIGTATSRSGSSAYISNNNTANSYAISPASAVSNVHLYKDIAFSVSSTDFYLKFWFKGNGENNYDDMTVRYSATSSSPVAGSVFSGGTQVGINYQGISAWAQQTVTLPASAFSGQTMRLVFSWRNDSSGGTQPPAAIDDITIDNAVAPGYAIYNRSTGTVDVSNPSTMIDGDKYPASLW